MAGKRKSKRATENGGREVGVWPFGKKFDGKMVNPRRECGSWFLSIRYISYPAIVATPGNRSESSLCNCLSF